MTWTEESRQLVDNSVHDTTIYVIWHEEDLAEGAIAACRALGPDVSVTALCGKSAPSCSFMWNKAIKECQTNKVVICNQKARPTLEVYEKMQRLLDDGYGLAGMYRYGFFGAHMKFYETVGLFDYRFVSGGYEDDDVMLRALEKNIAIYESEECPYILRPSAWDYRKAKPYFDSKWEINEKQRTVRRKIKEQKIDGAPKNLPPVDFLTAERSVYSRSPRHQNAVRKMGAVNVRFV